MGISRTNHVKVAHILSTDTLANCATFTGFLYKTIYANVCGFVKAALIVNKLLQGVHGQKSSHLGETAEHPQACIDVVLALFFS